MGDFMSGRISGHEGRGAGKTATPRGHIIVSRKRIVTEKKIVTEKSHPNRGKQCANWTV
jgi:hypothetical protein